MNNKARITKGEHGRWIIENADNPRLAWSGSRWVKHQDGWPVGDAQVANFPTRAEAHAYALRNGITVLLVDPDLQA